MTDDDMEAILSAFSPLCRINRISEATYDIEDLILAEDVDRTLEYMEAQLHQEYESNLAEFEAWRSAKSEPEVSNRRTGK